MMIINTHRERERLAHYNQITLADPFVFVLSVSLQVISLEGWTDIMYYVQDAHSFWDWVYFVLLIVVSDCL